MAILLHIETSTTNCSVCISQNGQVLALKEQNDSNYSHAENLHLFILEVLKEAGYTPNDLDAIAVSKGPGSYTGLRIGVSTVKGMCFALDKPLIAIDTLEVLARQYAVEDGSSDFIVPLIDARRMEVYSAVYNCNYDRVRETEAELIEPKSFSVYLEDAQVHFIGDGAAKCKGVIIHPNAIFTEEVLYPSANEMAAIATKKYKAGDFEDLAYFEPFYLKDFVGVKSRK